MLANIVKMKVAAVLLGPTGVGLIGFYTSLFQTSASVAALGLDSAGARQLAAADANDGELAVAKARRAILWGGLVLAIVGGSLFFILSPLIARTIVDDHARQSDVAWLSIGVALTVVVASQTAILTGLRRVGDLARINVGASVFSAALGITALWFWRDQALLAVVLIVPTASALITYFYVVRLGRTPGRRVSLPELGREVLSIVRIGVYAMSGVVVLQLGFLVVRAQVQRELGAVALGHFQAAWAIGVAYQALVLASVASDYFPRLTTVIKDRVEAARLINQQTEVGLLLCSPLILALIGFSPWVISIFYSPEFGPAVEVLRWQLIGDLFKMVFFPLGYALFALGSVRLFSFNQLLSVITLVIGVFIGIPKLGLQATGIAYLVMYLVVVPVSWWPLHTRIGFRWNRAVRWQMAVSLAGATAVAVASQQSHPLGAALGGALAAVVGVWALIRISMVAQLGGRLSWLAGIGKRIVAFTSRQNSR